MDRSVVQRRQPCFSFLPSSSHRSSSIHSMATPAARGLAPTAPEKVVQARATHSAAPSAVHCWIAHLIPPAAAASAAAAAAVRCVWQGSFPLDHFGECSAMMRAYLSCVRSERGQAQQCQPLAQHYLHCRMKQSVQSAAAECSAVQR